MKILKSKLFWFIIVVAGVGIWFYLNKEKDLDYTIVTVTGGDLVETVDVSARLEPLESAEISFESLGKIDSLEVAVGDRVELDQVLAKLDGSILRTQLYEAQLRRSIVEEDEKLARRRWDELDPETRQSKILASKAARVDVSALYKQLSKLTLYSPMEGLVSNVYVETGETASATMPIVRIISEEGLYLEANVPESDIVRLKKDQNALVTFDALDDEDEFEARITEIEPESKVIQDVVYYVVKFDLTRSDERLKPGMSADIVVEISRSENALHVPRRAVHEEDGKKYIEILIDPQAEIISQKKYITTGIEDDEGNIEVLEGLTVGDEIIL